MTRWSEPRLEGGDAIRLLTPDALTPEQHGDRVRPALMDTPSRRLMVAVLEDAIVTFMQNEGARRLHARRRFEEARAWIFAPDGRGLYSFETLCEALRIDPKYLREGLLAWRRARRAGEEAPAAPSLRRARDRRRAIERPDRRKARKLA